MDGLAGDTEHSIEHSSPVDEERAHAEGEQSRCICGNDFLPRAVYCRMCGRLRPTACPCGNTLTADAVFCNKCGLRRAAETRQLSSGGALSPGEDSHEPGSMGTLWPFSRKTLPGMKVKRGWSDSWQADVAAESLESSNEGFRLLDREAPFGQSKGRWNVSHVASFGASQARRLYLRDGFHTFLDAGSIWLHFLVYTCIYAFAFLFFTPFYLLMEDKCNLQLDGSFTKAYYLSMETMVTIGYGVPDPYYNGCWEGAVVITLQSVLQFFLNAVIIGAVFVRLTKPQHRANTVLFTERACIKEVDGALYFSFRVCDMKYHDLIEAHVRCYCLRHDRGQTCQMLPMRLQHPDDDKGGMLLTCLPNHVVHRIDAWSPLAPAWPDLEKVRGSTSLAPVDASSRPFRSYAWPEVPMRQADADQGNRDSCVCSTCGESYQNLTMLRRHMLYNSYQDPHNGLPPELCHQPWPEDRPTSLPEAPVARQGASAEDLSSPTRAEVEHFLKGRYMEVICLVEGIEPTTSSTLQARHSYLFPTDVAWDMDFVDCILAGTAKRPCTVDLGRFHQLVPVHLSQKLEQYASLCLPQTAAVCEI